jgi:hypothetical protein
LEDHASWWDDDEDDKEEEEEGGGGDGGGDDEEQRIKTTTSPKARPIQKDYFTSPKIKGLRLRIWKKSGQMKQQHEASSSSTTTSSSSEKTHPAEELQSKTTGTATQSNNIQPVSSSSSLSSDYDEEHPMRTDEWLLHIRLSRLYPMEEGDYFPECNNFLATKSSSNITPTLKASSLTQNRKERSGGGNSRRIKRQVMQFARNGYVKVVVENEIIKRNDDDCDTTSGDIKRKYKPRVGKWRIGHSGVAFDIPMQVMKTGSMGKQQQRHLLPSIHPGGGGGGEREEDKTQSRVTTTTTVLHYHADIHLNKFGERPRMFRGVITRDR